MRLPQHGALPAAAAARHGGARWGAAALAAPGSWLLRSVVALPPRRLQLLLLVAALAVPIALLLCQLGAPGKLARWIGLPGARPAPISTFDEQHIPWFNSDPAPLAYEGDRFVNGLPELLAVQSHEGWISMFMFNVGIQRWALNCIYSYIKFGEASNYFVAATDEASLQACMEHRLPCYNASSLLGETGDRLSDTQLEFYSARYIAVVWSKVVLFQQVLNLGYHVHFSDVDVVYIRPVWPSFMRLFEKYRPDAIFMKEVDKWGLAQPPDGDVPKQYISLINTGVYAILSNEATRGLAAKWLAARLEGHGNQMPLNMRVWRDFAMCESPEGCVAARTTGKAAVLQNPPQFEADGACPPLWLSRPCDPMRLYVHLICKEVWDSGWLRWHKSKEFTLRMYKMVLLNKDLRPVYNEDDPWARHPFLPCAGPAWQGF